MIILKNIFFIVALLGLILVRNHEKVFLTLVFCTLVFIRTFVDIGSVVDLPNYYLGYCELSELPFQEVYNADLSIKAPEIGFRYLCKICAIIFGDFKGVLFVMAAFNIFAYLKISHQYSPYVLASVLLFLVGGYSQSIFVIRQHFAIAVTILSYPYIINRDWKKYLLCMAIAFLFHQSSLIFLPVYWLYGIKNSKVYFSSVLLLCIVLAYSSYILFDFFSDTLIGYSHYIESKGSNLVGLFISLLYLLVYVVVLKKSVMNEGVNRLVFTLLLINVCMKLFGWQFTAISRLMAYFGVITVVAVPLTMKYMKNNVIRYSFLITVLAFQYYLVFYGTNAEECYGGLKLLFR